jgi:hypothetical protein
MKSLNAIAQLRECGACGSRTCLHFFEAGRRTENQAGAKNRASV